ncbi:MAG: capsule assembly Wzi family protein [Silvibacterium sp.]
MKIVPSMYLLLALVVGWQSAVAQPSSEGQSRQIATATDAGGGAGPGQQPLPPSSRPESPIIFTSGQGSTYVPMDSWIYPALSRLHGLGYLDTAYLGLRPWTRLSIAHMLQQSADAIDANVNDDEAREIYLALQKELAPDVAATSGGRVGRGQFESLYTQLRGITGLPLRDSFHLGQTIINDYGRPYEEGFNNYTGFNIRAEAGRFSLYFRGEYQHAPSAVGYSPELATYLSENLDLIPIATNPVQATIPQGPIAATNRFTVLQALLSYHILGHEISLGKNDHWWSPNRGGAMMWSTNAENTYAFEINRVEPLRVPGLSKLIGPIRYDFFVGSVPGHTYPIDPWVHAFKINFKPTHDLEFGFSASSIWGGKDRQCLDPQTGAFYTCNVPITLHTFLKSLFSFQNVPVEEKFSRSDPGYRLSSFDFTYRLPFLRNWLTLYTDSVVHDDVSPVSAPRRAGVRPGIYLSHFPAIPKLDMRVEGVSTDPVSDSNANGNFIYWETVQRQGPTINGSLYTDWIGRDGKGGQAWLTYHLSANEDVQFNYRNAKVDQKFVPGGTTQNVYEGEVTKRFLKDKDLEVKGWVQYERWKAPIYKPGLQTDAVIAAQIKWYPKKEKTF